MLTTGWVKSRPKGGLALPRAGLRKLRCTVRQHAKMTTSRIASRQPKRMPEQSGPQIDHGAPSAPLARTERVVLGGAAGVKTRTPLWDNA